MSITNLQNIKWFLRIREVKGPTEGVEGSY